MTWQVMGLRQKVQREMVDTGLPDDLKREFHALAEWAAGLPEKFGSRVQLRLVDVASIEGFVKSLWRRVGRYPAFIVDGRRCPADLTRVEAMIAERLGALA